MTIILQCVECRMRLQKVKEVVFVGVILPTRLMPHAHAVSQCRNCGTGYELRLVWEEPKES